LIKVEAVADNKFVLNFETDPAGSDVPDALSLFTKQNTYLHCTCPELFSVRAGSVEGKARVENIVNEKNISAVEVSATVLKTSDFSC
jgi:hypothetical protein